ncbi:type VII secretion protein EccB [Frankia sp. Cj5]|uniref:type VII secretion protein EccB n=1 Tax=Frankia sp. Cj5 TaxID=2880978 RepID=UPI001EF63B6C|nr:type VII secretion protein EccB [Frankia sp. Cj5]
MQTKRDQLQAYQFVVGRVVSALVRAEPDAPTTPTRRFSIGMVSGVMIAVLAVAGALIWGLVAPGGAKGWRAPGSLVVERETGNRYMFVEGVLHPVMNYASALLLMGEQPRVVRVSRKSLHGVPHGAPVGIAGAPDALPDRGRTPEDVWSVCAPTGTDDSGNRVTSLTVAVGLDAAAGGATIGPEQALLVQDPDGRSYLVWQGHRLRLASAAVQFALGYAAASALPVTGTWVNTLPTGSDLRWPDVAGRGQPGPAVGGQPTVVGQVLSVRNPGTGSQESYLVRPDGLSTLSPLATALVLGDPASRAAYRGAGVRLLPVDFSAVAGAARSSAPRLSVDWPVSSPSLVTGTSQPTSGSRPGESVPCVRQRFTDSGPAQPEVVLAPLSSPAVATAAASAAGGGSVRVAVPPGGGLLVRDLPVPGATDGTLYLITDLGLRYPLPSKEVAAKLGYNSVTSLPVPSLLLGLVPTGPALDPAAVSVAGLPTPPETGSAGASNPY